MYNKKVVSLGIMILVNGFNHMVLPFTKYIGIEYRQFVLYFILERSSISEETNRGREHWEMLRKSVQNILNLKYGKLY